MFRSEKHQPKEDGLSNLTSKSTKLSDQEARRQSVLKVFRAHTDADGHSGAILINENLVFKNTAKDSRTAGKCPNEDHSAEPHKKKHLRTRSELDDLHLKLSKKREKNKENKHPHGQSEFKRHAKRVEELSSVQREVLGGIAGLVASHRLTTNVGIFNKGKKSATLSRGISIGDAVPQAGDARPSITKPLDIDAQNTNTVSSPRRQRESMRPIGRGMIAAAPPYEQLAKRLNTYLNSTALFDQDYLGQTMEALNALYLQHRAANPSELTSASDDESVDVVACEPSERADIPAPHQQDIFPLNSMEATSAQPNESFCDVDDCLINPRSLLQLNDEAMLSKAKQHWQYVPDGISPSWMVCDDNASTRLTIDDECHPCEAVHDSMVGRSMEHDISLDVTGFHNCPTHPASADASWVADIHLGTSLAENLMAKNVGPQHAHEAGSRDRPGAGAYLFIQRLQKPKVGTPSPLNQKLQPRKMF